MSTSKPKNRRDRRFDPSLRPASLSLERLVQNAIARAEAVEVRARRRRHADQRTFEAAVSALVMNVVYRELEGQEHRVRVSMSKVELAAAVRPAEFMTEAFPATVRLLHRAEVVELQLGEYGAFNGRQSTVGPGQWLLQQLHDIDLGFEDIGRDPALLGPSVVLKGHKVRGARPVLPLPDTEEARQLVEEMDSINRWIAGADLDWTGEPVDLSRRHLVRVFSDGSLDRGGRLWRGFWMDLPKDDRGQYLRINGEPVVSLDFAHMGVTLAYSIARATPPEGDLYSIPGTAGSRDGVKKILNALLCSSKTPDRFPAGTKAYFAAGRRFRPLFEAISAYHPELVPLFGSALALRLQHLESQVMVRTLLTLQDREIVGLPIHDALLVGKSNVLTAKEILESTFREVTGVEGRVDGDLTLHLR